MGLRKMDKGMGVDDVCWYVEVDCLDGDCVLMQLFGILEEGKQVFIYELVVSLVIEIMDDGQYLNQGLCYVMGEFIYGFDVVFMEVKVVVEWWFGVVLRMFIL